MLQAIAPDIWHAQHHFVIKGIHLSTRMTVVRLRDGRLWLHSPIPLTPELRNQVEALGDIAYLVAPSKVHHLFIGEWAKAYPEALLFGPRGLSAKRPDLQGLRVLAPSGEPEWMEELGQLLFEGIPTINEHAWFHWPSRSVILTDLCQCWEGDLPIATRLYAKLTGVRNRLAVPRTIRLINRDREAARASAAKILEWPTERVIVAHNAIIEQDARAALSEALAWF
ncbi:uncharacterized protein DUF4336 [Paucimonas lemoignei]|uniref:Uncharacterized protein DUF4336 n=1 Tax=Paucimonas lemoignei TaxID=29443 RepID=A0A4V2UII0_PAULE|nr:DUF4336 domain-containing protein [Paucimonas lemoignei]TCS36230.1 uncharacterized protein DUF4336 [Paucimonas lemoignei]